MRGRSGDARGRRGASPPTHATFCRNPCTLPLPRSDPADDDDEHAQKLGFLAVPLASLVGGGIKDGMVIAVTDASQKMRVNVTVMHRDNADFDELKHPQFFEVVGDADRAATADKLAKEVAERDAAGAAAGTLGAGAASEAAGLVAAAAAGADAAPPSISGHKRPREGDAAAAAAPRAHSRPGDDAITLED